MGYLRIRSLSKDISHPIYSIYIYNYLNISPSRIVVLIFLTTISSSNFL